MLKYSVKIVLAILVYLASLSAHAQQDKAQQQYEAVEKSKSGNYKDIFASLFQLASKNLTGDEKTIEFNSTLFAVKAKSNPELLEDRNFIHEKFSRNFQFNFKVNLNNDYKYTGFTGGFTYAIINDRDKQLANFENTPFDTMLSGLQEFLMQEKNKLIAKIAQENPASLETEMTEINNSVNGILNSKTTTYKYTDYFKDKVTHEYRDGMITTETGERVPIVDHLHTMLQDYYGEIDSKALWTVAFAGTADDKGKFNRASVESIFLKGNKDALEEFDIRAKLLYTDTITLASAPRVDFKGTAGVNFKLAKNKDNTSFFETKIALEYNAVLKNPMIDEKKSTFLGNAEFRIRMAKDLWFPVVVKYDIEHANFLGFLNVTYNFGDLFK